LSDITVGILGLGRGFAHLRNFLATEGAEVIGACDWYESRHERAKKHISSAGAKTQLFKEFDEVLSLNPDAVVIASHGKVQVEHACMALEAGCHVVSEVPGAYTVDELMRLRETVERTGKTYMLAENTCFWDFFRYFRKWIVDDLFGPISIAEGEYLHYLPNTLQTPEGNRLTPSQAREADRTNTQPIWRADQPPIQYLTHDLGPLLEVLDDRCVSVTCQSGPYQSPEAPDRCDGQIALYQTEKGHLIKIMVTLNTRRPEEHRYRLFGIDGSAEWFGYEQFARRLTRSQETRSGWERIPIGYAARDDDTTTGHGGADSKVARAFIEAIGNGTPSPIDVYRCIEYCLPGILAARSADQGGEPVEIPDLRRNPFAGTQFWEVVGLPESDPEGGNYKDELRTLTES
jgi:predicted dehydrogenase